MKGRWVLAPVIDPVRPGCFEHTPLDYYRYGEYPRFLRPVDAQQPRTEWKWQPATTSEKQP